MEHLDYKLDDLPLVTIPHGGGRRSTGLYCDGIAQIDYGRDGSWTIAGVRIEVGEHVNGKRPAYTLTDAPDWLRDRVIHVLIATPEHWAAIQRCVNEQINEAYLNPEDEYFRRAYDATLV